MNQFPCWLDPTPLTLAFVSGISGTVREESRAHEFNEARREFEHARQTGEWLDNPPPMKQKGRPIGAKDLKPRKVAKHGPYRRR